MVLKVTLHKPLRYTFGLNFQTVKAIVLAHTTISISYQSYQRSWTRMSPFLQVFCYLGSLFYKCLIKTITFPSISHQILLKTDDFERWLHLASKVEHENVNKTITDFEQSQPLHLTHQIKLPPSGWIPVALHNQQSLPPFYLASAVPNFYWNWNWVSYVGKKDNIIMTEGLIVQLLRGACCVFHSSSFRLKKQVNATLL